MTHHHDHDHGHHHHEHQHDHHEHCHHDHHEHSHGQAGEMPFGEKMAKLLDHWLKHNADHAENYRDWARKASENHMEDVGKLLEEVAVMTMEINRKFEAAAVLAKKGK